MSQEGRVYHGYTPRYWRLTHTHTHDGSVPVAQVQVWSQVPSLVPVPIPAAGIPVGYKQGGRAKGEGYTSSGTMHMMVCVVPLLLYLLERAWDA